MPVRSVMGVRAPSPRPTVWALLGVALALSGLWLLALGLWRLAT